MAKRGTPQHEEWLKKYREAIAKRTSSAGRQALPEKISKEAPRGNGIKREEVQTISQKEIDSLPTVAQEEAEGSAAEKRDKAYSLIRSHLKGIEKRSKKFNKALENHQVLSEARAGNVSMLSHPKAGSIRDAAGMSPLHYLARKGHEDVIKHPMASVSRDALDRTPLHIFAENKNPGILKHPDVSKVKDKFGKTPLHVLATYGHKDAITHPDASKVRDNNGNTPLHSLAYHKFPEVEKHPDFDKVKNNKGQTPKDIYTSLTKSFLDDLEDIKEEIELRKSYGEPREEHFSNYDISMSGKTSGELQAERARIQDKMTQIVNQKAEHIARGGQPRSVVPIARDLEMHKRKLEIVDKHFQHKREMEKSILRRICKGNDPVQEKIKVNGVDVFIEWKKGQMRAYKNSGFQREMFCDYGYIPNTKTVEDGDEIDVYVGLNHNSDKVYIVRQIRKENQNTDEYKYMLGFDNITQAEDAFKRSFDDEHFGDIRELAWEEFLQLVNKMNKALDSGSIMKPPKDLFSKPKQPSMPKISTKPPSIMDGVAKAVDEDHLGKDAELLSSIKEDLENASSDVQSMIDIDKKEKKMEKSFRELYKAIMSPPVQQRTLNPSYKGASRFGRDLAVKRAEYASHSDKSSGSASSFDPSAASSFKKAKKGDAHYEAWKAEFRRKMLMKRHPEATPEPEKSEFTSGDTGTGDSRKKIEKLKRGQEEAQQPMAPGESSSDTEMKRIDAGWKRHEDNKKRATVVSQKQKERHMKHVITEPLSEEDKKTMVEARENVVKEAEKRANENAPEHWKQLRHELTEEGLPANPTKEEQEKSKKEAIAALRESMKKHPHRYSKEDVDPDWEHEKD